MILTGWAAVARAADIAAREPNPPEPWEPCAKLIEELDRFLVRARRSTSRRSIRMNQFQEMMADLTLDTRNCPVMVRLTIDSLRALDRLNRRAEHNDCIQDIRLQRQAQSLGFRLVDLAYQHSDHNATTICT